MWNRLAIVVGAAVSIIVPTWDAYSKAGQVTKLADVAYNACMKDQDYRSYDGKDQFSHCWELREMMTLGYPTLDEWGILLAGTAVLCLLIYGLIWLVVALTKWVWRGRETQTATTPIDI